MPHCNIVMTGPPRLKHMTLRRFDRFVRPVIETRAQPIETVCVVREPLDWLASWYRYRSRPAIAQTDRSTAGITFDTFLEDALSDTPPPHADVGRPSRFVARPDGTVGVDHLYRHDAMDRLASFLSDRFGVRIAFDVHNASPCTEARPSAALRRRVRAEMAADYELYETSSGC